MSADPWAGMADPRKALANFRSGSASSRKLSQEPSESCESGSSTKTEACDDFRDFRSFREPQLAPSQFRGGNPNKKSDFSSSSYIEKSSTCPVRLGCSIPVSETPAGRSPAKVAKPRKCELSPYDRSETALATPCESFSVTNTVPSPTAHLSGPAEWRDGLARLDRWAPPCPGWHTGEWDALHRVIGHFMDHFAVEAFARGWTTVDLFGVHRDAGVADVSSCGGLMLPWRRAATALTAESIAFGPLVYRRRPLPEAVLAWDFAGGNWREPA